MKYKKVEILLVEDSEEDIELTIEALSEAKIRNVLNVVNDGEEALKYLKKEEKYINAIRPDIIFLDLNLPKLDGRGFLSIVKRDPNFKSIPVIVLTTSKAEEDIFNSYNLHANSFISKPIGFSEFVEVVKKIEGFWFDIVKLPLVNED